MSAVWPTCKMVGGEAEAPSPKSGARRGKGSNKYFGNTEEGAVPF